ncbi:class C sortase [Corynebacterium pseudotuberculosis]|uniref:class C sortase n=1 Tax=Corynebacterium pseudotuberculosis TaxID=1719 RepID=UPI00026605C9|nr:class C sortase [Corynebacterium pseudotuberculosis]AFM08162.1 class C sortase [Corynebacterium pseudotuberculosis Cp162]APG82571.1 Sortase B [Corynebacterium pseudotuberculosis]WFP66988.1 class C sortase [Corynebacterium pseudotuberculosis]
MLDPVAKTERPKAVHRLKQKRSGTKNNHALAALLVIIGLIVMVYPVVSTQWNNWKQQRAAAEYAKIDNSTPRVVHEEAWDAAHKYNEERAQGPILDPWVSRFVPDNYAYQEYLSVLNTQDAMGRIILPSIKTDLPIYHGSSEAVLQKGIGHLFGSDLPVGGRGSHSVLTGHTGIPTATLFDNLNRVKEGDAFFIHIAGHKIKYEVDQIKIVLPNETEDLKVEAGKDLITLVTCTPYGINTHRLLVRGHQVPIAEEEKSMLNEAQGVSWQWWMYVLTAIFIVGVIGLIAWLIKQSRVSSKRNKDSLIVPDSESTENKTEL